MDIAQIAQQYWGLLVAFVVGAGYIATHYSASIAYAKKRAVALMLAAEKRAEELILTDGPAKFAWVVDKGYDYLPAAVRIIVSKPLFKTIVQAVFDEAIAVAGAHVTAAPVATTQQQQQQ